MVDTGLDMADATNATKFPLPPVKRMFQVGYGLQWKKGLQNWVAFPLVGLRACKKYTTLGRMGIGKRHGACQKDFQVWGRRRQFDGCHPTTGVPKHVLDEQGNIIATCNPKRSKLLCLQEGKIHIRGTCEDPPPGQDPPPSQDDGITDNWADEDEWYE